MTRARLIATASAFRRRSLLDHLQRTSTSRHACRPLRCANVLHLIDIPQNADPRKAARPRRL